MPKRYSGEYKQAAIQDCQNGIPIDEVSQTRGIAVSTIYRWLKNYEDEIKMQLHYIGIEENRFFSYSNMLEKMADIGSLDKKQ